MKIASFRMCICAAIVFVKERYIQKNSELQINISLRK